MSENNNSMSGYLLVAAVSAAVGAGIALLYAPQSGKATRKMLMRKGRALKDSAEDKYDEVMEFIEEKKTELQEAFESKLADEKAEMTKAKKSA